jgi:hypothetical protein
VSEGAGSRGQGAGAQSANSPAPRALRPAPSIPVGLFVLAFVTYAWFFNGGGWNQNAHFDLTRALAERQTLHIDGYRVNTGDIGWSAISGEWHAYSNKPPGLPFLAAIPYAALSAIERALGYSIDDWRVMTLNVYILTLLFCAIPGALMPAVLYRYARMRMNAPPRAALLLALTVAFGTIVFPYATMFFSVVPAALFLLLAFVWLDERPVLAGVCAGIAGICYYPCILAAGVLASGAFAKRRAWLQPAPPGGGRAEATPYVFKFIAGGIPFGFLLAAYHTIAFGAPWRTSLQPANTFAQRDLFLGLFRAHPTTDALWGLLMSEYRGLFFVSPVLVMALVGAVMMIRRRVMRRELAMIGAIAAIFVVLMTSFSGWEGGASFGPRHILQVIPLLAIPVAYLRGRVLTGIATALLVVSVAIQFIATSVNPMPDGGNRQPLQTYYLPEFRAGHVSVNRQAVDELIPHVIHAKGSFESEWASFNLGELVFGPGNIASVLPIALWMLLGMTTSMPSRRRPRARASFSCRGRAGRCRCRSRSRRR